MTPLIAQALNIACAFLVNVAGRPAPCDQLPNVAILAAPQVHTTVDVRGSTDLSAWHPMRSLIIVSDRANDPADIAGLLVHEDANADIMLAGLPITQTTCTAGETAAFALDAQYWQWRGLPAANDVERAMTYNATHPEFAARFAAQECAGFPPG